jgi:hypothetical protein
MEAHCEGGQGPPRAVMPKKKKKKNLRNPEYFNVIVDMILASVEFDLKY